VADLDLKLKEMAPLAIINGPLMAGMDEVGRLFNDNQLIVAEVLQSAEAMKTAVAHLEPFMEKSESSTRATMVLATVKGDVHDIGKNLVEIILGNNGYRIINLGIKVPPEDLIGAYQLHKPDAFGLSGSGREDSASTSRRGESREGTRLRPPLREVRRRDGKAVEFARGARLPHLHETLGVSIGQGLEQHAVHCAEDRRAGANAEA